MIRNLLALAAELTHAAGTALDRALSRGVVAATAKREPRPQPADPATMRHGIAMPESVARIVDHELGSSA